MDCPHTTILDTTCISCGLIITTELVSYTTHTEYQKQTINYKYTLSNSTYILQTAIENILQPINKLSYTDNIMSIISKKKDWKKRYNMNDKIIVTSYYVMKKDNIPVVLTDFVGMSKKGVMYFLKLLGDEFPYLRNSDCYVRNLIERVFEIVKKRGSLRLNKNDVFRKVMDVLRNNDKYLSAIDVILFVIFDKDIENVFMRYEELSKLTSFEMFRRCVNRIGQKDLKHELRNKGVKARIDRVREMIKNNEMCEDEIDLLIEKKLLLNENVDNLTMKEIRTELEKEKMYFNI